VLPGMVIGVDLNFPDVLRRYRVTARLTQEQLAEKAGLNVRSVSQLERGRVRYPRPETVYRLGRALDLTATELDDFLRLARVDYWADRNPDTARSAPAQLPSDVLDFTGRVAELAQLDELLADTQLVAVSGTAGVGKTALVLRWAHRAAARFPDGQLYVNLRGYDPEQPLDAGEALARFLRALGVPASDIPSDPDERAARYRTELTGRRILILADNAATVEQVRPLLPGTVTAALIVTSRDSLPGLVAVHGAHRLDVDLLPSDDASTLLRRLIGARADADPTATTLLVDQCARLPLALRVAAEFAAARSDSALADLTAALNDEQRRLDLLDAGGDPRAAVAAVLSWSYRHLAPDAAGLLRLLGLHPGADFDKYAAAALAAASTDDAERWLAVLVRAHLLAPTGAGRYAMHDLLRAYTAGLAAILDDEERRRTALTRLFDYYLATAASAMDSLYPAESWRRPRIPPAGSPVPKLTEPDSARGWLDTELDNLIAVATGGRRTLFGSPALCSGTSTVATTPAPRRYTATRTPPPARAAISPGKPTP
jgi:transcriptional regulator with XRE-family HTH domain